jgi:hypothetical protein
VCDVKMKVLKHLFKVWEQDPEGEPYKVTESTPVYGCCMGLRSDIIGCRYCLCTPCWEDGAKEVTRGRRGDRSHKDKLKDKGVGCADIPERHLRINLAQEHNGNYFKPGLGGAEKSCPTMCCGCLRPLIA